MLLNNGNSPCSEQQATCSCLSPEMARSSFKVHSKFIHRFPILGERISSVLGMISKKKQGIVACYSGEAGFKEFFMNLYLSKISSSRRLYPLG
ncbi:hypothetical protein K5X82_00055 [Halosquirtibacter xylanolyticus]|uniref:hypothetical protein n=1 Tax=Halosquirtibacter xylanolyticus TaxID=3374599 RepID=UPI003749289F|nr:hypothetical protein K5X82_00055 [Prolixibacteraceae bacterium]